MESNGAFIEDTFFLFPVQREPRTLPAGGGVVQGGWRYPDGLFIVSGRREWPRYAAWASSEMRRCYSEFEGDKARVDQ